MKGFVSTILLALICGFCSADEILPDLPEATVVIYNPDFPQSRELAEYYAQKRGIPSQRLIGLKCPNEDSISRAQYETLLREPLYKTFVQKGWWKVENQTTKDAATGKPIKAQGVTKSSVKVLALMRGIPFQIRRKDPNPTASKEDEASVDSELTLLATPHLPTAGAVKNPYYNQPARIRTLQGAPGLLLVGRLDGPGPETVKRMIDDSIAAEQKGLQGRAVIDLALKTGAYQEGENWLNQSAIIFRENGIPVYVDRDEPVIPDHWPLPDTAIYFGWYTTNASGALNSPSFRFRPGAIACHLHSFSASAMRSKDKHWVGPLLEKGAAAVLGNVYEPYLSLTVHFDTLNQRLLEGFTLAEAAWNATPVLSWMNVVVGDPLYRPFAKSSDSAIANGKRDHDFSVYQANAFKHSGKDTRKFKAAITQIAETDKKPHLLELLGLLSSSEGKNKEAIDFLEHALTLYETTADRVRVTLYLAELHRRDNRIAESKIILQNLLGNKALDSEPALEAAKAMLKTLE